MLLECGQLPLVVPGIRTASSSPEREKCCPCCPHAALIGKNEGASQAALLVGLDCDRRMDDGHAGGEQGMIELMIGCSGNCRKPAGRRFR